MTLDNSPDPHILEVENLGKLSITSPLKFNSDVYVSDSAKVLFHSESNDIRPYFADHESTPMLEIAGPRKFLYFDPAETVCGIVTCGGLCPGLNDVIRAITLTCKLNYNVKKVLGFRYGYEGVSSNAKYPPMELTPETVDEIHHRGGTIIGSSRGPQDSKDMVKTLIKNRVNILFVIGGDGTLTGAHELVEEIQAQKLPISVIGIPKTIDNDIYGLETSFGFRTAVEEARKSISCAHEEAKSAYNGIGLVKLMGRDSGFITVDAALANSDVNFCLIPEEEFQLKGDNGLFARIEKRLERRHHAVIAVAEGAGQHLMKDMDLRDKSGNKLKADIGPFLKSEILNHLKSKDIPATVKYIDPSYTIRSCPANARDSIYCLLLGQMAVHAGMAGKTDMFVGFWNQHYTHVPLEFAIHKRKKINTTGFMWQTLSAMCD
jgi:6-phosphofructokinase 1